MKKLLYEKPLAEIFELHLQRNVLQGGSPNGVNWSSNPGGVSGDDTYGPNDNEGF